MRACLENPRWASFCASRLVYAVYICLAIFPIGNLGSLMDGLKICTVEAHVAPGGGPTDDVYKSMGSGPTGSGCDIDARCENMGPILGACITTAIASALALIAYTVVDYKNDGGDFTRGLLVGAGACVVLILIQSTADFIAVGKLVQRYNNEGGHDVGSYSTLLATGAFALLSAMAMIVDAAVRTYGLGAKGPGGALSDPLYYSPQ